MSRCLRVHFDEYNYVSALSTNMSQLIICQHCYLCVWSNQCEQLTLKLCFTCSVSSTWLTHDTHIETNFCCHCGCWCGFIIISLLLTSLWDSAVGQLKLVLALFPLLESAKHVGDLLIEHSVDPIHAHMAARRLQMLHCAVMWLVYLKVVFSPFTTERYNRLISYFFLRTLHIYKEQTQQRSVYITIL